MLILAIIWKKTVSIFFWKLLQNICFLKLLNLDSINMSLDSEKTASKLAEQEEDDEIELAENEQTGTVSNDLKKKKKKKKKPAAGAVVTTAAVDDLKKDLEKVTIGEVLFNKKEDLLF